MEVSSVIAVLQEKIQSFPFPKGANVEITSWIEEAKSVGLSRGRTEIINSSQSTNFSVRVLLDGRQGIVTATSLDEKSFPPLCEAALEIAQTSPRDENRRFAYPSQYLNPSSHDEMKGEGMKIDDVLSELKELNDGILSRDLRFKSVNSLRFLNEKKAKISVNSLGLVYSQGFHCSTFLIEVIAQENQNTEVAWEYKEARLKKDIPFKMMADEVADRALRSLGAKTLTSGTYTTLLHPRVGTQFLSLLSRAFSAEAIQNGRSFLQGKMNQRIGAVMISLLDDPLMPGAVASSPLDDEGVPREKITLIEEGILQKCFYDIRSAARDGVNSNGRASRPRLSSPPSPGPTNMYLKGGSSLPEEMIASDKKVFFVHEIMGLHMADSSTGEFSLGASGFLYENGKFSHAVKGVTIAGSLLTLLGNTVSLGRDVIWYGQFGAPHILASGISVAGA